MARAGSTAARGQAASVAATVDSIENYPLIEAFPASQRAIGRGGVLVCFAVPCVLAIVFVNKFLPATKELSVEQITEVVDKQAQASPLPQQRAIRER